MGFDSEGLSLMLPGKGQHLPRLLVAYMLGIAAYAPASEFKLLAIESSDIQPTS